MRAIIAAATLALAGCATTMAPAPVSPPPLPEPSCPAGQTPMRTVQLFFGRHITPDRAVTEAEFKTFLDEVLTPAFPAGLTVIDGGGQWRGVENQLIRESSKVVIIVAPGNKETADKINAVRQAYKTRFNQESVLLVTQRSCVAF